MFTLVIVRDGQVNSVELPNAWEEFKAYRDTVIAMEQHAEVLRGAGKAAKPRSISQEYEATNIASLYSPLWTELASTRCRPWEKH